MQLEGTRFSRILRQGIDAAFGWHARRHSARLDAIGVRETQEKTLLRLVLKAAQTQFGREHRFHQIRSLSDYRRQVPLRHYEDFWTEYWYPGYPVLQNVTWPGRIPFFALSSGTTAGTTKSIPVSPEMLASNQAAALTSLSWFKATYPETPLLTGRLFFLGGSTDMHLLTRGVRAGDLSGIVASEASCLMRPFAFPPADLALVKNWDDKLTQLAERGSRLPITMLSGVPSWLLVLFDRLRGVTGKRSIADIWPTLRLVIHGGTSFEPYRTLFRETIGSDEVRFLETYPASEGFVAAEDPRFGTLRLMLGHDIFFEFVPVDELSDDDPTRHAAHEVELGERYAVVLTTCAGLWSYVLGDVVVFERRNPPLLRFAGRTKQTLSAFGEHVIGEEADRAIAEACDATGAAIAEYHVGAAFPDDAAQVGRHRWLIEFLRAPSDLKRFAEALDGSLRGLNEDYDAHRQGDLTMLPPEAIAVRPGGFSAWMRSRGKLGGQHKVPRLDGTGRLVQDLSAWLEDRGYLMTPLAQEPVSV
jgi:hypothetical protein